MRLTEGYILKIGACAYIKDIYVDDVRTAYWDSQCRPYVWKTEEGARRAIKRISKIEGRHQGESIRVESYKEEQ